MPFLNTSFPSQFENIHIKIELDNLTHDLIALKNQSNKILGFCLEMETDNDCFRFHHFLDKKLEELEFLEKEFMTLPRRKRHASPFFPDHSFLWFNPKSTPDLDANRKLTIKHIKFSNETLSLHKSITENLTSFISILENRIEYLEHHEKDHSINELIHLGILSSNEIYNYFSNIIHAFKNKDPTNLLNLLNIKNLNKTLILLQKSLSNDTFLPDQNLFGIIKSSDFSLTIHDNIININIMIPILSTKNSFLTYKIIPIPFIGEGGGLIHIISNHDILFHNPTFNESFVSFEHNVLECKNSSIGRICPRFNILHDPDQCELHLFSKDSPSKCKRESVSTPFVVTRLNGDTFHAATLGTVELKLKCQFETIFRVKNDMTFRIPPGCSFYAHGRTYSVPNETNSILYPSNLSINFPHRNLTIKNASPLLITDFIKDVNRQITSLSSNINKMFFDSQKRNLDELGFLEKIAISIISILIGVYIINALLKCIERQIHRVFNAE